MFKPSSFIIFMIALTIQTTHSKLSEEAFLSLDETNFDLNNINSEEQDRSLTSITNCQTTGLIPSTQSPSLPPSNLNGNYAVTTAAYSTGSSISYVVAYSNNMLVRFSQGATGGLTYALNTTFAPASLGPVANEISVFGAGNQPLFVLTFWSQSAKGNFALALYGPSLVQSQIIYDSVYFGKVKFYNVAGTWYAVVPSSSFRIFKIASPYLYLTPVYDGTASQFYNNFYSGNSLAANVGQVNSLFYPAMYQISTTNVFQQSGQTYLAFNYWTMQNQQEQVVDIINITNPSLPSIVAQNVIQFDDQTYDAESFNMSGTPYVAYANTNGLYIYSYTTPQSPSLISTQSSGPIMSQTSSNWIDSVSTYVTNGVNYLVYGNQAGVYSILDITNIANPKLVKNVTPQVGGQITSLTMFGQMNGLPYNLLIAVSTTTGFEVDYFGTTTCTNCIANYYWASSKQCMPCANGGYPVNGVCQACNAALNCQKCLNQTACSACGYPNYYQYQNGCVAQCPAGTTASSAAVCQ